MERHRWKQRAKYVGLLTAAFLVAFIVSSKFGGAVNSAAYDFNIRQYSPPPWHTDSVLLAIDEDTLRATPDGMTGIRKPLAEALRRIARAKPKAVAIDLILADKRGDPAVDAELAGALCATPNVVLSSETINGGTAWENPLPEFANCATAVGHVHAQPDEGDSRTRAIPLYKRIGIDRRWAIALEAFRLSRGKPIIEELNDLRVGDTVIPVPDVGRFGRRQAEAQALGTERRIMRVRFIPPNMPSIPRVSMQALLTDGSLADRFAGKVVFVGVTAQTEAPDRLLTPVSPDVPTTGLEIHAQAFETMDQGLFITDVSYTTEFLLSLAFAVAIGLAFRYLPGWWAYAGGGVVLVIAQATPYAFFTHGRVFPFATSASVAWLVFLAAAAYYHLVVRRNWLAEQSARTRYQQAMHFVTHEMRTPLSTIQGSSELMSRYALTEEKRKQIVQLINSESKRLARMVEIFLNVERLSAGQMELKREPIAVKPMVELCVDRVRPLAERKHIGITAERINDELQLTGDRELMEYACYNLLTNAVKYSPQRTEVTVRCWIEGGRVRIAVEDQGIGMDQKEVKQIFQKFYRTRKAEESGEAGTGIGLSIVQQIVEQHGGQIDVTSQPGAGSCFTLVLPPRAETPVHAAAERQ
jgi:signal transduction histidine kinase